MLGRVYHHDPGLNHEIMEEFQKLGYPVFSQSLPADGRGPAGPPVRRGRALGGHHARPRYPGRVEERLLGQYQPEDLGGEVHGAPSEPGGAGDQQLQVRTRCADLHRHRGDHRELGHAVLRLQGSRREQADWLDQDSRRDDRLLPEALSRGPAEEGRRCPRTGAPVGRVRARSAHEADPQVLRARRGSNRRCIRSISRRHR